MVQVSSMFRDAAIPFEEQQIFERLTILNEECAEVQKEISKIFRFGSDAANPLIDDDSTNHDNLQKELGDLVGMIKSLTELGFLDHDTILFHAILKQEKIKLWMRTV